MLEEAGRVVAVDELGIWVEANRTSSCQSCTASKGCGQKALVEYASRRSSDLRVENPSGLAVQVGDRVTVGIREGSFLKASLLIYTLPLLMLFFGGYLGSLQGESELPAIFGSSLGLLLGLLLVRSLGQRLGRSCQYQPVLLKVIPRSP